MAHEVWYSISAMLDCVSISVESLDVLLAGSFSASYASKMSKERRVPKATRPGHPGEGRSASVFELFRWFCRASRFVHPGVSPRALKRKCFFVWRCMRHRNALLPWYEGGINLFLSREVALRPKLLAVVEHPYMCSNWSAEERLRAVEMHYSTISAERSFLCFPPQDRLLLLKSDQVPAGVQLVLEKPVWLMWEGELVISLFEESMRRYSLAFSLGTVNGEIVAYVGALQGIGADNMIDVYRALTHSLHGMRPRDFLFTSFRLLCRQLGVQRILAASEHASMHRSHYFKRKVKMAAGDYDAIWTELGGVLLDSSFFEIGVPVVYRQNADIPTRKRAQYRRRYEMLDGIAAQIEQVCSFSPGDIDNRTRATTHSEEGEGAR